MNTGKTSAINSFLFTEIIRFPWGSNDWMSEEWVDTLPISTLTDTIPRKMRAPIRVRTTPWGGIMLLANDPAYTSGEQTTVYHFSHKGVPISFVKIDPPPVIDSGWRIEDFLMDQTGHLYLLETIYEGSNQRNYLRKLTPESKQAWIRSGPTSTEHLDPSNLQGTFRQLLIDKQSTPYIAATQHRGLVMRIDVHNGTLDPYAAWGEWTGEVFMDGKGKLYYVRYLPKSRQRCWASYDPQTKEEHVAPCDASLYGFLAMPIAVDDQSRGYAVMGMRIACIGDNGTLLWQEHIDNIILDQKSGTIYTSTSTVSNNSAEIHVREWVKDGGWKRETILSLPPHLLVERGRNWWLASTNLEGRYYVYGGEKTDQDGILLVYSSSGVLEDERIPAPDIHLHEYLLQAARTWSVDLEGNVYLPVSGPESFHIIKLSYIQTECSV